MLEKTLEEIQSNLDYCVRNRDNSNIQYAECLRKHGYQFTYACGSGGDTDHYYYAVHYSYYQEFKNNGVANIPDWAIRSIPYEVYIK
jgi:hypothetical protein